MRLTSTVVHTGTQLEHSGDYSHGDNLHKLQYRHYCLARGGAAEGVKPHTPAFKYAWCSNWILGLH
jgi:hypothetical protein